MQVQMLVQHSNVCCHTRRPSAVLMNFVVYYLQEILYNYYYMWPMIPQAITKIDETESIELLECVH
jgi:hypothetical protein